MPDVSFTNLLVISVVAVLAPLVVGFVPRLRIPAVVLEIVAGIVLGPSVLGWVHVDLPVQILALLGLAFLLFLAGLEIDARRLRGRVLRLAVLGYLVTLVLGAGAGFAFGAIGWVREPLLLAVALSATSLGLVVPVLKDAGQVDGEVGQSAIAAATVADFVAVVLLIAFVVLAERFGLESILGAFLAGAVVSLVDRDTSSHPHFRTKLEAIGYGFVVPVFFISSGVKLDLTGLLAHPSALLRVPLFLLALLVVRGVPALLALPTNGPRATAAIGLLQATSLPFIVTATQIGMTLGKVSSVTGAALVMAGLLSVLIFPLVALGLLRGAEVDSQPWMSYGSGYSGPRPSRPTR